MTASVIATTVTTPVTRSMSVFIADRDCTNDVLWQSLRITDAGKNQGSFDCTLDAALSSLTEFHEQAPVLVIDHDSTPETMFRGFLKGYRPLLVPGWTRTEVRATGHDEALDVFIPGPEPRPTESAKARIGYLWGKYANHYLSPDLSNVTINVASVADQNFENITLHRALDEIVGQAAPTTGAWYLDQSGKLHVYTSEANAAPDNIDADSPGAGEIAPHGLQIDWDAGVYFNTVYVQGANAAGSGYVYDHAAIAKAGGSVFSTSLMAPNSDTAAKRDNLGAMYLGRVKTSAMRGSFSVSSPNDGWRAGQTLTVTAADASLSAEATRIERVSTRLLSSDSSKRRYEIEFGRPSRSGSGSGPDVVHHGFSGSIGGGLSGTITDDDGNALFSTDPSASGGAFGPAARRQITSGVANGDFVLPPVANDSEISAANVLPYWTLTKIGTEIRATSVFDGSAASERVIQFVMGPGAATDDTYIEQLIPVNGARGRSFVNLPSATFLTGATVSNAQIYITAQYLTRAGNTTGSANTSISTTTSVGASTVVDRQAGASDDGQIPSDAYYLRVRVGFKRNTAAVGTSETVTLCEVRLSVGGTQALVVEATDPASFGYGSMYQQGGLLRVAANQGGGSGSQPTLRLRGDQATGQADWENAPYLALGSGSTSDPPNAAGLAAYRTDRRMLVAYDGSRVTGISAAGWQPWAFGSGGGPTNTASTARDLAVSGGSIQIPIFLDGHMDAWSVIIWNTDTANAREAEWRLYEWRNTHTTDASEIASFNGTWSFTPGGVASQRTSNPAGVVYLSPGAYILVIRNTSGAQTFGIGEQAVGTLALNAAKTKTLGSALGATLDLHTSWTGINAVPAVRLGTTW
jgi:hypothetical protein